MITSIEYLKKFGCYDELKFDDAEIKQFNKVNVLFGSNGSGKTTLSNLLYLLSKHCKDKEGLIADYIELDTEISIQTNQGKITEKNISTQQKDIYVFNSKFISDHVYNGTTSNVAPFDSDIKLTNAVIKLIDDRLSILRKREARIKTWKTNTEQTLEEIWNSYKDTFQEKVSDARLTGKKPSTIDLGTGILMDEKKSLEMLYADYTKKDQEILTKQKFQSIKSEIDDILMLSPLDNLSEALSLSVSHLAKNSLKEKIEILQNTIADKKIESQIGDLNTWFRTGGRLLHLEAHNGKQCPLCGTDLTKLIDSILDGYKTFFNDTLNKLLTHLDEEDRNIREFHRLHLEQNVLKLKSIQLSINSLGIKYLIPDLDNDNLKQDLASLLDLINSKKTSIQTSFAIDDGIQNRIRIYSENLSLLKGDLHKKIDSEINDLAKRSKKDISDDIKVKINNIVKLEYNSKERSLFPAKRINSDVAKICQGILKNVQHQISKLNTQRAEEVSKLDAESKFVNYYLDHLGILHFTVNRNKSKVSDNITITYNKTGKQKLNLRTSLSEGEKTALAFAYFISKVRAEKLESNDQGFSDSIIVIDDPISSLDDNRLFQTANTIDSFFFYQGTGTLDDIPSQVFIFSHNQTFTKYLYGALKSNDKLKGLIGEYYLSSSNPRIRKVPSALKNFTSTYLIKLREIVDFKEKGVPDYEVVKNYLPNYIRIVLETFLSFKLALVNDDSDRVPGLSTLIRKIVAELLKSDDYEVEMDGGKLTRDAIVKRLNHLKKIADHESHGNIAKGQEVVFIAEDELKVFSKYTIQVIQYIDSIHLLKTKGHS